jgi:hypothetical protein
MSNSSLSSASILSHTSNMKIARELGALEVYGFSMPDIKPSKRKMDRKVPSLVARGQRLFSITVHVNFVLGKQAGLDAKLKECFLGVLFSPVSFACYIGVEWFPRLQAPGVHLLAPFIG